MANAKKILVTTESREVFVLRSAGSIHRFCPECRAEVAVLTIDQAVSASGLSTIEILNRMAVGQLHHIESASGHLLICGRSLEADSQ